MDTKIKLLILCLLSVFTLQAQTPNINFAAKFQITSATGSDPYNIVGIVSDDLSRFTGSDVHVNDSIYVIDGSDLYVLAVTSITSVVGPTVTLVANDPNNAGVAIPTGQAAILKPTTNYKLPLYISGLRSDLQSMVQNRFAQRVDLITGGGSSSITDFISAGIGVPPSPAASGETGETWRNMSTGELWRSDGGRWHPFVYDGKECQDTVLVSAITVQSGGSVTTGSPLVKSSGGVWQHMYNHPSGLNLIPDGVVVDIIGSPAKALINYCGVRKGSGATPNTSYYVDQSISTGFTTTKPTTNIRPLGKVASNGDFLVNAGLLFSRDNSPALPAGQVGYGDAAGTGITSDTTLKFYPTSDKLRVSSPSNKGYTELSGKTLTINPDTLQDAQIFLNIQSGRSNPYAYAPYQISSFYSPNVTVPYKNIIFTNGYNMGPNGNAIDPTKPMFGQSRETSWNEGGVPTQELHEVWQVPDSTTIRLESWRLRYPNATNPTFKTELEWYGVADIWSLKKVEKWNIGGETFFSLTHSRTDGTSAFNLGVSPISNFRISGSTNNTEVTIANTFGAPNLTFGGFANINLSATSRYDAASTTFIARYLQADIAASTPRLKISSGLNPDQGIWTQSNIRLIGTDENSLDYFIGRDAGPQTSSGYTGGSNIGIGWRALRNITSGQRNIAIGTETGRFINTTRGSISIGDHVNTNTENAIGTYNKSIVIGDSACFNPSYNVTNKLVIENSPSNTPLIGGDFATNRIGINVLESNPQRTLHINGEVRVTDLTTDTPTKIVGADADGDLGEIAIGSKLTITSGTLNVASTLMREESFTATAAQTAFTIAYSAPAVSGTSVPIRVYRNGVRLFYVASGPTITQFTYSGTTVTTAANTTGDIITIEYLN